MKQPTLRILGTRGVPARHGGFETFAEHLARFLRDRGWRVIVYCQAEPGESPREDTWEGIERVHIPAADGAKGTVQFDWLATRHAARSPELCLTLGYNTAVFCAMLRLKGIPNVINMDGIEWRRGKWGAVAKTWFWLNDWAGCWLGNHLVADHPEIARHLATRTRPEKITMIPYGATEVADVPTESVQVHGLVPGRFLTVIARAEPENNLLEVVRAFSKRPRGVNLVVLGKYDRRNPYHEAVLAAGSEEVRFIGAIYDPAVLASLRFHSLAYVHGHSVGGTNPSLVEALAAGNAVLAHDNRYNRWVAGDAGRYFANEEELTRLFDGLPTMAAELAEMRQSARNRVAEALNWPAVLGDYERLLMKHLPVS